MSTLRLFAIVAWISLPTVMAGGSVLLGRLTRGGLSEFQLTYFRAGHAHAGVLVLMSLLYIMYMDWMAPRLLVPGTLILIAGVLAQSGGFFLHLVVGAPGSPSAGTWLTRLGAVLLTVAIAILVYGLLTTG